MKMLTRGDSFYKIRTSCYFKYLCSSAPWQKYMWLWNESRPYVINFTIKIPDVYQVEYFHTFFNPGLSFCRTLYFPECFKWSHHFRAGLNHWSICKVLLGLWCLLPSFKIIIVDNSMNLLRAKPNKMCIVFAWVNE